MYFVSFIISDHCYRGGKSFTKSAYLTDYKTILIFVLARTAASLHKLTSLPTGKEENLFFLLWHTRIHKNFKWETKSSKDPKLPLLASLLLYFLDFVVKTLSSLLSTRKNILMLKGERKELNNRKSDDRKYSFYLFFLSCFLCVHCGKILCCWENKQKNFHCHVSLECKVKLGHETVKHKRTSLRNVFIRKETQSFSFKEFFQ